MLRSFSRGSSPGPDGFRPDWYKQFLSAQTPERTQSFLAALARFTNIGLKGQLPPRLSQYFSSAALTPLANSVEHAVRPVCVGNALRHLLAKVGMDYAQEKARHHFTIQQVGLGVPCGGEAVAHAMSSIIKLLNKDWPSDEFMYIIQVDYSNAFNLCDRATMFREVRQVIPGLAHWVEWCYGSTNPLLFLSDGSVIANCKGVQQGDPLGALLFSLVNHVMVRKLVDRFPTLPLNVWFMERRGRGDTA